MKFDPFAKLLFLFILAFGSLALPLAASLHAETVQAPTDVSASGELAFWNKIKKSESAADFEVYFTTFPNGMFTEIARTRYQELGGKAAVETPSVDKEIVAEPEEVVIVKKPKAAAKKTAITEAKPKKRAASVFVKKKKSKAIVAYAKARSKAKKANYTSAKPKRKYVAKPKKSRIVKPKYNQPKAPKAPEKVYVPSTDPSGVGGGGGGGSSGGGGGWGG